MRPRSAAGEAESNDPRTKSSNVHGQKTNDSAQGKRKNLPFLHLFVLFGPSTNWVTPTHTDEGRTFLDWHLLIQMITSSGNTLMDTSRNVCFYQLSQHPLAQSSWHIRLIFTDSISMLLITMVVLQSERRNWEPLFWWHTHKKIITKVLNKIWPFLQSSGFLTRGKEKGTSAGSVTYLGVFP